MAGPTPAELEELFGRIPKAEVVRRSRVPRGLTGWRGIHWVVAAVTAVTLFWMLGGTQAAAGPTVLALAASAALGGFVVVSYLPRGSQAPGARSAFSPCAAMPLFLVLFALTTISPDTPPSEILLLGLFGAAAAARLTGSTCPA